MTAEQNRLQLEDDRKTGNMARWSDATFMNAQQQKLLDDQLDEDVSARYAVAAGDTNIANDLAGTNYTAVEARWNAAGSMEEKLALAQLMSETSGGRANLRKLMDNSATTIASADRLAFGRAMQRQRSFATLDKKAEDIADFFKNSNVSMADASRDISASATSMGGWDAATFGAVSAAKAAVGGTQLANFNAAVQNAIDDPSASTNSKIAGQIGTYATGQGLVSAGAQAAAAQATRDADEAARHAAHMSAQTSIDAQLAAVNAQLAAPPAPIVQHTAQYVPTIQVGSTPPPPRTIQMMSDGTYRDAATGAAVSAADMAKYKSV